MPVTALFATRVITGGGDDATSIYPQAGQLWYRPEMRAKMDAIRARFEARMAARSAMTTD
jgi:hypothetical protein